MCYSGHLLAENRNGLMVDAEVSQANGTAERDAALVMMEQIPGTQPVTVGGDKGFDTRGFVEECRDLQVTPHVAQNLQRRGGSAIDGRTTRHDGYAISQSKRKRIEECFGWMKTIALMRKVRIAEWAKWTGCSPSPRRLQSGAHAESGRRSSGGVSPRPTCVSQGMKLEPNTKTPEIQLRHHQRNEKQKEKLAADQFFSSLLGPVHTIAVPR